MLFCCLWRNVETSCHKHFVDVSREQQTTPLLPAVVSQLVSFNGGVLTTPIRGRSVDSSHFSQILAQSRDFCLPHLHSTPLLGGFPSEYCYAVWYGKTRMVCLPDGENILKISLFVLTQYTNVTDRQTDTHRQTCMTNRPRLFKHSTARQKQWCIRENHSMSR